MWDSKKMKPIISNALCWFLVGLLAFDLTSLRIPAQTASGAIRGTVLDPNRAAIPGATLTLANEDTNISRQARSSELGIYYFGNIPPGRYRLLVEGQGFSKWAGSLVLEVGQTVVVDPVMQLGSFETTIDVKDVAPTINTDSMVVGDVKDSVRIQQLPLNGRFVSGLFNLTAGVEGGSAPRVNGLKVGAAEMLLDGSSIVDYYTGGLGRAEPGLETIQEFRIETVGSSAQFSRPATITLLTKSGTNTFHGSVFETHRNNYAGLRARQRQDGDTAAKLIRNEFGGSAGGPVNLGKLYDGHDKTFWFASYEGLRQREQVFQGDFVPTEANWNGDFSQQIDANGNLYKIYDPLTTDANGLRQPFPGNIVPPDRISPFYKKVREVSHLPTNSNNPFQFLGPNMETYYPDNNNRDIFSLKIDHKFSNKDSLSGRFTRSRSTESLLGGRFGSPKEGLTDAFGTFGSDFRTYTTTLTHTHTFSPTLLNELLVAGHRSPNRFGSLAQDTAWADELGLPNPFGAKGWPTFYAYYDVGNWDADNQHVHNLTNYSVENNLTWVKGKHTVKVGGKGRYAYDNSRDLQQAQGSHVFTPGWTGLFDPAGDQGAPFTGSSLAAMALGLPGFLSNQYNRGYFYFQQKEFGLYFQDNWKVTPRLTLDLGLRWDKWTPYKEKYDRLLNVDLNTFANKFEVVTPHSTQIESLPDVPPSLLASWTQRGLTYTTADSIGFPGALLPNDNNNFGPRIGAAFKLTDKTVLRGGYGEYFWTMPLVQILAASRSNPPLNLRYSNDVRSKDGTGTFSFRTRPLPEFFIGQATVDVTGIVPIDSRAQGFVVWDARDWKDNRAQSWHLTLEREVMHDTSLRLSYIGDHGRGLEQRFSVNTREAEFNYQARTGQIRPSIPDVRRVNPNWNFFQAVNHTGYSNTNSFQAEVERRYSNGLAFQVFYVFTRSLTTTDAGAFSAGNGDINDTGGVPSVPENGQILGEPNLSYDQRLRLAYYNSTNIPAQRVRWNGIYDLPFGPGKRFGGNLSGPLKHIAGGWQLATIGNWGSGRWLSLNTNGYLFGDPTLTDSERLLLTIGGRTQRLWFRGDFDPTQATNVSQEALERLVPADRSQRVFHPLGPDFNNRIPQQLADGSIRLTPIGDTFNPTSRAFFRGPGAWNTDLSLFKNFAVSERIKARFTADFFNVFNHPNDVDPNSTTGLQDLSIQPNEPRIVQFSLRFQW